MELKFYQNSLESEIYEQVYCWSDGSQILNDIVYNDCDNKEGKKKEGGKVIL